jgi:ribose transport system permease protein
VIATAVGVLFLSQLEQVVELLGATQAVQDIIQGAIVALGMGLRNAPWRRLFGARAGIAGPGSATATGSLVPGAPHASNGPPVGPRERSSEEEETVDVKP